MTLRFEFCKKVNNTNKKLDLFIGGGVRRGELEQMFWKTLISSH